MLHNSISVDVKVYGLHLKQQSTVCVFRGILQNFRRATFNNDFGKLILKESRGAEGCPMTLVVSRFSRFSRKSFISHQTTFLLHKSLNRESEMDNIIRSIWIMLSIFINLKEGFYYQDFSGRNIWLLLAWNYNTSRNNM